MKVLRGDCRAVMLGMEANSVDAIVTDPPYELGFMGKSWDKSGIAFDPATWAEALRVLKPGGHMLAFSGSRTYHRMACAIEDAGFEVRDQIMWVYGSGFPKSHDVSKGIDKAAGAEREVARRHIQSVQERKSGFAGEGKPFGAWQYDVTAPATAAAREWDGWGTALKPAHEPIVLARKPLSESTIAANVLKWGTGAINVGACRVPTEPRSTHARGNIQGTHPAPIDWGSPTRHEAPSASSRWPANLLHDG